MLESVNSHQLLHLQRICVRYIDIVARQYSNTKFPSLHKEQKVEIIVIVLLTKNIFVLSSLETFLGRSICSKPLLHLVFLSIIAKTQGPLRLTEEHALRLSHQLATSSLLSMQDHHWQANQVHCTMVTQSSNSQQQEVVRKRMKNVRENVPQLTHEKHSKFYLV